jgi:SEC-C motif-containing protein
VCGSGKSYEDCCAPLHRGEREAADVVSLMRSRYAAFAMGQVEYLWRTLHPGHADRARPREDIVRDLRRSARSLRYRALNVLDSRQGPDEGQVLFVARVHENGRDQSFVELSTFLLEPEGWRYFHGTGLPLLQFGETSGVTIASFQRRMSEGQ